jgi:AcrR family transcriptional regulator
MAAEDRRRAIVAAVIPLLADKGASVKTADIAKAARIAEGTIFRAFPDKPTLFYEALKAGMDPAPVCAAIENISAALPLKAQLARAAELLLAHWNRVSSLGEACRSMPPPTGRRQDDGFQLMKKSAQAIQAALVVIFERRREELCIAPAKAGAAFRGLIFAGAHPLMRADQRLDIDDVLAVLLTGIARREGR